MSASELVQRAFRQNLLLRTYKYYIIDSIVIVKENGFKELVRRRGVKFLCIIAGYYLVRDSLLYVIIPWCLAKGIF